MWSPRQVTHLPAVWGLVLPLAEVWVRVVNMFGVMVMVRVNTTRNINPDL